jgi:hypothetical protein
MYTHRSAKIDVRVVIPPAIILLLVVAAVVLKTVKVITHAPFLWMRAQVSAQQVGAYSSHMYSRTALSQ